MENLDIAKLYNKLRANYCSSCECDLAPKTVIEFLEKEGFECTRITDDEKQNQFEFNCTKKSLTILYTGNWYDGDGMLEISGRN